MNGPGRHAVSYTHLDVYKRQMECRPLFLLIILMLSKDDIHSLLDVLYGFFQRAVSLVILPIDLLDFSSRQFLIVTVYITSIEVTFLTYRTTP